MKFAIITHVPHGQMDGKFYAYAPYVNEMNIWLKFVDDLIVVAPLTLPNRNAIDSTYNFHKIDFRVIKSFHFLDLKAAINAVITIPKIIWTLIVAMKNADHIHLRCPGNVGLLGCIVQIFFPSKPKTAKYAGNWDPNAQQPLSYKIQKWILSNTLLTKKMNVLVYGEWQNQSINIKPFFTATYSELDKKEIKCKKFEAGIHFIFVGTLTSGKNPLYAIQIIEKLSKIHPNVQLNIYGEGIEKEKLQSYINTNQLKSIVFLHGNQNRKVIQQAYIDSHFVILPSKSEGWPKALAEGMFWKCVPIATPVSCVPNMLDNGNRGVLLDLDLNKDVSIMSELILNHELYVEKSQKAMDWSRKYNLNFFEAEIKKLIKDKIS